MPNVARIGDHAGQGRGGRGFRAAKIYLVFFGSRSAGKISGNRSQADAPGRRGLPHADAAIASGLMNPGAGMNQFFQISQ